ncbi:TPA: hypothetical protein DCZ46_01145 [Candidatus Campbellbacteria bacterium]|nr:MAG: seg [Candidatus Campbellbacteria bacterium GW2011_OD1_34_28]KKP75309.1 MAG: hypothetical protein UR74_C0001G0165 [Candidatus Campbellbacteria bacterium GW2011_GWD2_35_24]KKP76130.1 MAG: hypothetical protein UR75_C0001G0164 [Candidatus Campbellbacteria bacterium GW2011_GWC2_35_28]KKP77319.1 MAG: hypothetical protein UR76_C0001G0164 [Candidatus Campbellbacteria bacterium GW2011_GWC1_35_31]KKP79248.1 MAG: hypothetical protein UR79_C0001G0164 [Candidatus Campbellbacteria bacterium GW2011_GW
MLTEEDKKEIEKIRFMSEIKSEIRDLDFQRNRIFEPFPNNDPKRPRPTHDADFYMVLLRRLYRRIENEQHDSRVGNLKGKFNGIHKKIKIRDHYEHNINYETFPQTTPGIIMIGCVVINETNPHIVSGNQQWLLKEDHEKFKKLLLEFAELYPFEPKPKQKQSLVCNIIKKLFNKYCKK